MKHRIIDILLVTLQFGTLIAIFTHPSTGSITYPQVVDVLGPIFLVSGILIGMLGVAGLRRSLSIFPTPSTSATLITNGAYKYARHPMYTALILIAVSFTLCRLSLLGIVLFFGLLIILFIKSRYEERMLARRFNEYEAYRKTTGRFFPKL